MELVKEEVKVVSIETLKVVKEMVKVMDWE
jgi:hypothetical protein